MLYPDTYCEKCRSLNYNSNIRTERLEGTLVYTRCAVTVRFALRTKYFSNEENQDTFRGQYEAIPFYEKAL